MNEETNATTVQEPVAHDKEPKYDFRFMMRDEHHDVISEMLKLEPGEDDQKVYMTLEVYGSEAQARRIAARTAGKEGTETELREALWSAAQDVTLDELMGEKLPEAAEEYSEKTSIPHRVKALTNMDIATLSNLLDAAKASAWERYGKD